MKEIILVIVSKKIYFGFERNMNDIIVEVFESGDILFMIIIKFWLKFGGVMLSYDFEKLSLEGLE